MGNQFVNLPVPVGNGVGAWVDVSTFGSTKTLVVDGSWTLPARPPTVNLEMSNELVPAGTPAPVCTFQGRGIKNVETAARWMRVRVSNFRGGVNPIVNMGGNDDGCLFANLPVTPGNGTGAPVDISALGSFKTVQVGDPFGGSIIIEYSEDAAGLEWAQAQGIQAPGQFSSVVTAFWARAKRVGVTGPGFPIVNLAGTEPSGGGGSAIFTTLQVQELRFEPEISPPALAAGETDDYNPFGFDTTTRMRQATNVANSALSGLAAQNDGDLRIIENLGPGTLTFENEDLSSGAANRFTLPNAANLVISSGGAAMFLYDATTSRWLPVAAVGVDGASGSGTLNTLAKFTGTGTTIGDSRVTDDGVSPVAVAASLTINTDGQDALFSTRNGAVGVSNLWAGGGGQNFVGGNPLGPEGHNTAFGIGSLVEVTTGFGNVAVGYRALALGTTAYTSTAVGHDALGSVVDGIDNTAVGYQAGRDMVDGTENTTVGTESMLVCTVGAKNCSVGFGAGFFTTGTRNVAMGYQAGGGTTGIRNVAIGSEAGQGMQGCDTGIAIGAFTMAAATSAEGNIAIGGSALTSVTIGQHNTAIGLSACAGFTTGQENVAVGNHAMGGVGGNGTGNVAVGSFSQANKTNGDGNTTVGYHAGDTILTGEFNTVVGCNVTTGITTGRANTIIGGSLGGLAPALSNNIILADGDGNMRARWDAGAWTFDSGVVLAGILSPAALGAGDNPNYAPAGLSTSRIIRLTSGGAASTLSGLLAGVNGRIITLVNVSGDIITVLAASGLSAAANQFASGTVLAATGAATSAQSYFYDGVSALWRTI